MDIKKPVIGMCAAFEMGERVLRLMIKNNKLPDFVVTCVSDTTDYKKKIVTLAKENGIILYENINVSTPEFVSLLKKLSVDLMLLIWWPDIIKQTAIESARIGWLNMHPALLPYGRGKHPYYWSIVEEKPFGATLHLINEGIDTGPIIFQKEVPVLFTDTGESIYPKAFEALYELFEEHLSEIMTLSFKAVAQDDSQATFHWAKELEPHSEIHLDKEYTAKDLINRLRGRSFSKGASAFCYKDGKKFWLRINIEEANDAK